MRLIKVLFISIAINLILAGSPSLASIQSLPINDHVHFDLPDSDWEMIQTSHVFKKRVTLFRLKNDSDTLGTQLYLTLLNQKKTDLNHYFGSEACLTAKEKMKNKIMTAVEVSEHVSPEAFSGGNSYCTLHFSSDHASETQVIFPGNLNHNRDTVLSAVAVTIKSSDPKKVTDFLNRFLALKVSQKGALK